MAQPSIRKGAAPTAPEAPLLESRNIAISSLPAEYRKAILFLVDGHIVRLTGRRALVLDRLINFGPAGIDRAITFRWVANLSDAIVALRAVGVSVTTRKGQAANYALACVAQKIGGAI